MNTRPDARRWQSNHWVGAVCRFVPLFLLIVSFAGLQTAAALESHPQHHGGAEDHCCAICHVGQLIALATPAIFSLAPPEIAAWSLASTPAPAPATCHVEFCSSRAPPA
jgi:hypothetical protein